MTKSKGKKDKFYKEPTEEERQEIQRRLEEVRASAEFLARVQKLEERQKNKPCEVRRYSWHYNNNEVIFEGAE